jgi:hypothetical protein
MEDELPNIAESKRWPLLICRALAPLDVLTTVSSSGRHVDRKGFRRC